MDQDLAGWVKAIRETMDDLAADAKDAFVKISDDAQFEFDKLVGKAMAENPELYAELRKTYRQVARTVKKIGEDLGLK